MFSHKKNTSNAKRGNFLFFLINHYALQERHGQNEVAEAVWGEKECQIDG